MTGEIVETPAGAYVRCNEGAVSSDGDVLDLLGLRFGTEAEGLLLEQEHLAPEFFDLKTGLLGAIFLKLSNYRVKTAIVAELAAQSPRFRELIYECNRRGEIRFFNDRAAAERWLVG